MKSERVQVKRGSGGAPVRTIERVWVFPNARAAVAWVAFAAEVASGLGRPLALRLSGSEVRLSFAADGGGQLLAADAALLAALAGEAPAAPSLQA